MQTDRIEGDFTQYCHVCAFPDRIQTKLYDIINETPKLFQCARVFVCTICLCERVWMYARLLVCDSALNFYPKCLLCTCKKVSDTVVLRIPELNVTSIHFSYLQYTFIAPVLGDCTPATIKGVLLSRCGLCGADKRRERECILARCYAFAESNLRLPSEVVDHRKVSPLC